MAVSMISAADRDYIRDYFAERLTAPVTLELFTQKRSPLVVPGREECEYCEETTQLLREVSDLSDQIELVVHDVKQTPEVMAEKGVERVPAIVFRGANKGTVRFFGIPAGNEFRNLIDGIVEVAAGESGLSEDTRQKLAALDQDLHVQVFVTPT